MPTGQQELHDGTGPSAPLIAYGGTVASVALAVLARWLFDPLLGDHLPFVTFFVAVAVAAWVGGLRPALLATVLGFALALFLFVPPRLSVLGKSGVHLFGLVMYFMVCLAITAFGEAMRAAQRRSRQVEQAASAERERLRITLACIGDAVITTDAAGSVTYLNPVAESLTGWAREDAVGRPLEAVFAVVNEQTRERVEDPVRKVLREGKVVGLANHTLLIHKDGTERPIDDSAAPIRDDKGQVVGCVLVFRDVSERRQAEVLLRRREHELADFFENATLGLHWVGPDGIILRANRAELELLGYSPEEYIGHHIAEFHVDEGVIRDILSRLQGGEKLHDYQARLRCKDGSIRHVLINSSVMWEDGRFVHTRCFTRDITDRQRVQDGERLLASIVDSSDDAIISKSLDGIIQSWNAAAERLFGYTAEQAVGRPITMLIPAERIDEEDQILARLRAGDRVNYFDTVRLRSDGRPVHVSLTISPVRDEEGRVVGASKIVRDITDRRQAEDRLRESEERFRNLFDAMDEGFCVAEMEFDGGKAVDYRIVEMNPAFERHTGLRGILGQSVRRAVPGLEEFWFETYGRAARTGEPTRFVHQAASLGERWFDVSAFRLGGDGSNKVAILFTDISDRKRAEREREELVGQLQEADRRKDEFLAVLAHELRNPLAPLRTGLQVMKVARHDPEAVEQARAIMERQLGQMVHLIDDLMDLSRVSRGKVELRKGRVDLATVVRQAVETSRPLIEDRSHDFALDLPADPIYVDADATRLAQVFSNLLNNAAKYTDPGGRIRLAVARRDGQAVVSVQDNGVGIPAPMLPKVFDIFTQVDRSLEKSQGGLGIGLSLVKKLVEMHGGTVEAKSDGHGLGSEFVVTLPVVLALAREGGPLIADPANPRSAKRRVLVADDNVDAASTLAVLLGFMGNEVRTANDGLQAVEAAAAFKPDVVLLDIGMPKLNGLDACRRIREQPWGKGMVLIALTGWGQEDDRRQTSEAGFDHHIVKPVDPAKLEKLLIGLKVTTA